MDTTLQKLFFLQELTAKAGINDSFIGNAVASLQARWNDSLYQSALQRVLIHTNPERLLSPFELPRSQLDLTGSIGLGRIIGAGHIRFKIPQASIPMHWFTSGSSGSGKTEFALYAADQILVNQICPVTIIDPKADEYLKLAHRHSDILILKWSDLRFNPFSPPPGVPKREWYQTTVGHLAQSFNFWQGAESLILKYLVKLSVGGANPTPLTLLQSIQTGRHRFGQKDAMVKSTVVSRLEMLLHLFAETITTDSDMLEFLHDKSTIISTSGLMAESESWFTEFLLLWKYMYRVFNPTERNLTLHVYDECQHRLFSNEKELKVQKLGASLISKLVDESRALNIGICSLSQEPSTLIKAVINNSWLKVAFRLGSGSEIRIVKDALGLTEEQAECIHYLEPGEAIVRMAGIYMDAFPVKFDRFESFSVMSHAESESHQEQLRQELYQKCIPSNSLVIQIPALTNSDQWRSLPSRPTITPPTIKRGDNKSLTASGESAQLKLGVQKTSSESPKKRSVDQVKPILQVWLNLDDPFLTQGELFEKIGITSGSKQAKIKKQLIQQNFIIDHKLQVSKAFVSVWEPTERAYALVGIKKPRFRSKGGYLHQFIAHRIKKWAELQGYEADIEFMLETGKALDLALRKPQELVFVEIAVSPPLEKEISNLLKDLATDLVPDRIILAAIDGKMKRQLEHLIAAESRLDRFRDRIEIMLAGSFLRQ